MADKFDSDDPLNSDSNSLDDDAEVGEDWESAFKAEDFMFSPEEDGATTLLKTQVDEQAFIQPNAPPTEQKTAQTSPEKAPKTQQTVQPKSSAFIAIKEKLAGFVSQLGSLPFIARLGVMVPQAVKDRFASSPKFVQAGLIAAPVVMLAVLIFGAVTGEKNSAENETTAISESNSISKNALTADGKEIVPLRLGTVQVEAEQDAKDRVKWPLASFFITAPPVENGGDIVFITVDLTLVAALEPGQRLPEDKKTFVRDVIYQFFNNRPLYDLRRYSLARGELKENLLAWLNKQWPQSPIENILFNRYQLS